MLSVKPISYDAVKTITVLIAVGPIAGVEEGGGSVVTSHDVARLAGVSQPTVSRALRDSPKVSEVTRRRVREAATALGYVPSDTGRALSVGRTHRVGLLVTDLANQFYTHTIAPMHHALESLGYQLVLHTEAADTAHVADRLLGDSFAGGVLGTTPRGPRHRARRRSAAGQLARRRAARHHHHRLGAPRPAARPRASVRLLQP